MRYMGLDYGSKTIGIALSDPMGWTASALETIHRKDPGNLIESLKRIRILVEEHKVETFVVGMPKHMNNDMGERADRTLYFIKRLNKEFEDIPVETMDERLSSVSAERILMEGQVRRENRKTYIDQVAAAIILQNYLDMKRI